MQIQLSSVFGGQSIVVNALLVAELAPVITLIILSVVTILGFQEKALKHQLKALVEAEGLNTLPTALARTSFFVMPLILKEKNKKVWLLLSAERLTLWSLAVAVLISLAGMMSRFVVNLIHLTDSVLFNYASAVLLVTFILSLWLMQTRKFYLGDWGMHFEQAKPSEVKRKSFKPKAIALLSLGLASLFCPWTTSMHGSLPGSYFLIRQTLIPHTIPHAADTVPIEPKLYAELRIQIWIAIAFLCVSLLLAFWHSASFWRKVGRVSQIALGVITIFLSLNLVLYMAILEYESEGAVSWSFQNALMSATFGTERLGLPLEFYNPSYGLIVFMTCCLAMFWYSVKNDEP